MKERIQDLSISSDDCIWICVPQFQPLVDALSREFNTPVFAPHITIVNQAGIAESGLDYAGLKELCKNLDKKLENTVISVSMDFISKPHVWESFILSVEPCSFVANMTEFMAHRNLKLIPASSVYHISLMYHSNLTKQDFDRATQISKEWLQNNITSNLKRQDTITLPYTSVVIANCSLTNIPDWSVKYEPGVN